MQSDMRETTADTGTQACGTIDDSRSRGSAGAADPRRPAWIGSRVGASDSLSLTVHSRCHRLGPSPVQTFSVESLLSGRIDVLSLLHYLHEKQHTGVRDLLTNMLYDLELVEIDSILPQLIHLSGEAQRSDAAARANWRTPQRHVLISSCVTCVLCAQLGSMG